MTTAMSVEKAYTVPQLAELLDVNHMTIRRAIDRGELRSFRVGSNVRVSAAALRAYMGEEPPQHD